MPAAVDAANCCFGHMAIKAADSFFIIPAPTASICSLTAPGDDAGRQPARVVGNGGVVPGTSPWMSCPGLRRIADAIRLRCTPMRSIHVAFLLFASLPLTAKDAAMFRGDPEHSGVYEAPGVPQLSGVKWKFKTGGRVMSSPAVVEGTVYVGSNDDNLYAIDAESGALRWKFKTGSRITSSPGVADGLVYFGSFDGNFYAVDARTGGERWKFSTGGERRYAGKHLHGAEPSGESMPDPFDFFLSSPAITESTVYFG